MKVRKSKNSVNRKLINSAIKFQPFDYGYLLNLEKEALSRMYEYFKVSRIAVGNEIVERDIKLALKLLDIILEIDTAIAYYEDDTQYMIKYVNIRNSHRFHNKSDSINYTIPYLKNYLRIEKAWYLYHKLRYNRMKTWYD